MTFVSTALLNYRRNFFVNVVSVTSGVPLSSYYGSSLFSDSTSSDSDNFSTNTDTKNMLIFRRPTLTNQYIGHEISINKTNLVETIF